MPAKRHVPRLDPKLASFKLALRRSRIERFGVFAQEAIPSGKKVIEYAGERINGREAVRRSIRMFAAGKAERVYLIRLNRQVRIDGSEGGSGAEFVNHSCDPNLTVRKSRGHIFFYSFRKIKTGEELTVDYGFRCSCPCRCGSSKCRGTMCHI
jgi:SET domain-containing protein